ncbi:MAG: 23S rRNA (uracil(1939)-C(5))-methyltransferase RlmD [Lachnoclostridium sp.]|nr:23S rRNA (uracil(1939)-C(5))-methyltransferase RlmD [Lachnoclostridium sp.]
MKKNDKFVITIEDMSEDGAGIGKLDGYIWFVKDALIGDVIEASAMKMKKNYGFARLVRVIEPAPGRVEARCPVARACGGCQMQELDYAEQLKFKEKKVYNHLKRIGGMEEIPMEPIIGMEHPWRYRNKAQFPIGTGKDGQPIAGFYAGRTHSLIPVPELDCLLGCEENKDLLRVILDFMKEFGISAYDENLHKGLVRHALLRKGFSSDELMVCLVINGNKLPHAEQLVERLLALPMKVTSISLSINKEKTNVIMGTEIINLYGPGYITDKIGNIEYRISPLSFYQVNPVQTERLYGTALEFADLSGGETVWDLYCGIGTISSFLAQKAGKVYGVEIIPEAIDDARANAERNGIKNVEFFVGKAEEVLPEQYEKNQVYADVIVVDPPRKGCDSVCLDTILKMAPKKVVYVSCDSSTLARDVKYLCENGYEVKRVRPVDMFPMSGHVETVCLLSKLNAKQHIEINLDMDELDLTDAEKKATYQEIKDYVLEHSGLKVSSLYIAQVKQQCGIIERENYNKPKSEDAKQPQCPPDKEKAIKEALKHFGMI